METLLVAVLQLYHHLPLVLVIVLCCLLVTNFLTLDSITAAITTNISPSTPTSIVLVDNMVHGFSVSQQMNLQTIRLHW